MSCLPGMTRRESDLCKDYWRRIRGQYDMDQNQAALDDTRAQLGEDMGEEARQFLRESQEHIDALRNLQARGRAERLAAEHARIDGLE